MMLAELTNLYAELAEHKDTIRVLAAAMDDRRLGYGCWCPRCEDWLNGIQNLHTHCRTCGTEIVWKPLSHLLAELRREQRARTVLSTQVALFEQDEQDGCPHEFSCCSDPKIGGVDHDCGNDDCSCDENYMSECASCGAVCGCEV